MEGGDWGPTQISEGAPVCYPLAWLIAVASLACFFFSILFFDFPIPSRPRSLFTHQYFLPSLCFSRSPVPPQVSRSQSRLVQLTRGIGKGKGKGKEKGKWPTGSLSFSCVNSRKQTDSIPSLPLFFFFFFSIIPPI